MTKLQQLDSLERRLRVRFARVMTKRRWKGKDAARAVRIKEGIHRLHRLHPFGPHRMPLP